MADVWNTTRGGALWRTAYKYRDSYASGASRTQIWIETPWDTTPQLRQDLLGYATWDQSKKHLNRQVPLAGQFTGGAATGEGAERVQLNPQRCSQMDLELFWPNAPDADHVYPASDPGTGDFFLAVDGYVQYALTFGPTPYYVLTDEEANAESYTGGPGEIPPECKRFVKVTRRYLPEARKTPSAGFVCYHDGATGSAFDPFVIQEVGFIPTFQIEIIAELIEWPVEAFPDNGITECLGKVNSETVHLMGKTYGPGTLLYKGPARETEPTDSAAGYKVINIPHLFGYRPQLWNRHRLNDGRWMPLVVKGTEPAPFGNGTLVPQFAEADYQKLFQPG